MKMVYMGHHRFLSLDHPYCRNTKPFERTKSHEPLEYQDGRNVFREVSKLKVVLGKGKGILLVPSNSMCNPLEIAYFEVLESLDPMHRTRNVCTSTLSTLMDTKCRTNDSIEI